MDKRGIEQMACVKLNQFGSVFDSMLKEFESINNLINELRSWKDHDENFFRRSVLMLRGFIWSEKDFTDFITYCEWRMKNEEKGSCVDLSYPGRDDVFYP